MEQLGAHLASLEAPPERVTDLRREHAEGFMVTLTETDPRLTGWTTREMLSRYAARPRTAGRGRRPEAVTGGSI